MLTLSGSQSLWATEILRCGTIYDGQLALEADDKCYASFAGYCWTENNGVKGPSTYNRWTYELEVEPSECKQPRMVIDAGVDKRARSITLQLVDKSIVNYNIK